jgi:hypothetical protein
MPGPPARSRITHHAGGLIEARHGLTESFDDKKAVSSIPIHGGGKRRIVILRV